MGSTTRSTTPAAFLPVVHIGSTARSRPSTTFLFRFGSHSSGDPVPKTSASGAPATFSAVFGGCTHGSLVGGSSAGRPTTASALGRDSYSGGGLV